MYQVVELVGGGSGINGAYPVYFSCLLKVLQDISLTNILFIILGIQCHGQAYFVGNDSLEDTG